MVQEPDHQAVAETQVRLVGGGVRPAVGEVLWVRSSCRQRTWPRSGRRSLGFYEESIGRLVAPRRPPRRLHWLTLILLLPWLLLIGLVGLAVTRPEPEVVVRQQRAVSLYRQLSGKDRLSPGPSWGGTTSS
jgi:hypothetical protein